MNFELKIQGISNIDTTEEKKLAVTHSFEIDDPELISKKGKLLAVLSIKTDARTNLESAAKVFLDTLKEEFYRITDETPLSSLESAVSQGLRMLYSVKTIDEKHTLGSKELHTDISLSTALVWNRVLYTSYYGGGVGYILRGSGIRDISSQNSNLNEIWTNSSILDNDDVIIIGTKEFAKAFPTNTIIESFNEIPSLIAEDEERNLISAVFIKLSSIKNEGRQNFNKSLLKSLSQKGKITEKVSRIKDLISRGEKLSDRFKIYQKKKVAPVSSISGIIPTTPETTNLKTGLTTSKRLNKDKTKKPYKKIATTTIGIIILTVIGIGGYRALNYEPENTPEVLNYSVVNNPMTEKSENAAPKYKNLHTLIPKDENTTFGDFAVKNESTFLYIEKKSGDLLRLDIKEDALSSQLAEFENPRYLHCDNRLCYLVDTQSLYVLEPKEDAQIDKYLISEIGIINNIAPYNNRVYLLGGNTIYQQTLQSSEAPTEWVKDETTFTKPIDLAIDGNVYILDGTSVIKMYGGKTLATYDLSDRLTNPINIEVDIRNFYILDQQKRAVYIFSKGTGDFVKEIELTDEFDPSIPESLVVFEKNNSPILYFLKDNEIFKVE